jgi:hypothetical protein
MKTAGQRFRRSPEKVQNWYELYENWLGPVRVVTGRFSTGFFSAEESFWVVGAAREVEVR